MYFLCLLGLRALCKHPFRWNNVLQDWFLGSLLSFVVWPLGWLVLILAALDSILWRNTRCRLALGDFAHFFHARSFTSSLSEISWLPEVALLSSVALLAQGLPHTLDTWGILGFLGFTQRTESPNALFSLTQEGWTYFRRPRLHAPLQWEPQGEKFKRIDPQYPLLRKTLSFEGPKTFELAIAPNEKPHVICVFLESFRAKDIGALGGGSNSPCFDRLAKEGILFSQFHSQATRTSHGSIAALYGIPPAFVSSYLRYYLDIPLLGLPHIFEREGYTSCFIQGGPLTFLNTHEFFQTHGFSTLFGKSAIQKRFPEMPSMSWGAVDEATFRFAAEWLASCEKPAFLSLFTISNHHPWRLPWSHESNFQHTFAYTDACLGQFVEQLEASGVLDRSILLILSDHGYGQGERDSFLTMNRHLYQENIHIPLLIYAKNRIAEPKVIDEPASQIDLLPTVLDLMKIQGVHHSMGRSLQRAGSAPIFLSYSSASPQLTLQALRKGRWKYILQPETGREELYDLERDPQEAVSLATAENTISWKKELLGFSNQLDALYQQKRFCPKEEIETPHFHFTWENRLDIEDKDLDAWCSQNSTLSSLELKECFLLTDAAVRSALAQLPNLETLKLEGLDEVMGDFQLAPPGLASLTLLESTGLSGTRIAPWIASLSGLCHLKLDVSNFSRADYAALQRTKSSWQHLELRGAGLLDDECLSELIANQINLKHLHLEGAAVKSLGVLQAMSVQFLLLERCPDLTDETLRALLSLPLRVLCVRHCPNVKGAVFKEMNPQVLVEWR